jgi:type I restriction enzyme S subunit
MKFGLEQHIIDTLIAVFEQHPKVDKALVFGSRAKGNYRPDSDIDIAIKGQDLNTDDIIAMSVAFEEKGITHKIDLINYDTIKEPDLKDHIKRVGIELYSRWKSVKLQEIVSKLGDGLHGTPEYDIDGEYYFINGNNLIDGKIVIKENTQRVTEQEYLKYKKELNDRTILLGINGTIGNVAIYNGEKCILGKSACYFNVINDVSKDYIKYVVMDKTFQTYIENFANGSTIMNVSLKVVRDYEFALPPIPEQTAIAKILTSLDDKIDLLHRQNKTLEQLAETLFRSYFPMTNEENKYVELGNYVDCINGVSYKSSELNPSKVGMVSLKSFDRNGGFSIDGFKEFTGKFKEKQEVVEGDLIVAHTDITQDAEVIGNPALVISNPNFDTLTISMDIVKVISKVDWISIEFLYFLMRTREFKSHCEGCANGSTVLHLNKQAIPTFEFPEPGKNNVADFTKQAREIVSKIFLNHRQLRNLVKTRNTLLPKLMSGEVRVNL